MFKRMILAAIALSVFAVPMAQAQSRYDGPRQGHHYSQPQKPHYKAPQRQNFQRPGVNRNHMQRPAPSRHHWSKGQRIPAWQRKHQVRDYHRYGLKRSSQGQQWVKVDNDYLLIGLATGIIFGMASAR